MQNTILHDIEDDAPNKSESLSYYAHFTADNIKEAATINENFNSKVEEDYHNSYYLGKGKYGSRALRMSNKKWHKLNV